MARRIGQLVGIWFLTVYYKCLRVCGVLWAVTSGSGAGPQPKLGLVHFKCTGWSKNGYPVLFLGQLRQFSTDFNHSFTVTSRNLWRVKFKFFYPPHLCCVTKLHIKTNTTANISVKCFALSTKLTYLSIVLICCAAAQAKLQCSMCPPPFLITASRRRRLSLILLSMKRCEFLPLGNYRSL